MRRGRHLQEHRRRDPESSGQPSDLSDVQIALAGENFRDDTLAAHLGKIRLRQSMVLHKRAEDFGARGDRYRDMNLFACGDGKRQGFH